MDVRRGFPSPRPDCPVFAVVIFILYTSVPISVMCGFGKAYRETAVQQLTAGAVAGKEVAR